MILDPCGLANELRDASNFEQTLLAEIGKHIPFDAAFFALKGAPATSLNLDHERLELALSRGDYEDEITGTMRVAGAHHGVAVDSDVHGEQRVRSFAYHRDLASKIGGKHSLFACVSLRGEPIGGMMLGRCGSTFSESEIARIEAVLPHVGVARASYFLPWNGAPTLPKVKRGPVATAASWISRETVLAELRSSVKTRGDDTLVVRDRRGFREMVSRGAKGELVWSRAAVDEPSRSGWFYIDLFHLAAARAKTRSRALFIGCGGAVALRQFARVYPGIAIDVVESDARVVDLARTYFALGEIPNVTVTLGDGVAHVAQAREQSWDVILVDAYDGANLATGFASPAFFTSAKRALTAGGCLGFNAIGALSGASPVQLVERGASSAFNDVRLVPVTDRGEEYDGHALRNVVILAQNR